MANFVIELTPQPGEAVEVVVVTSENLQVILDGVTERNVAHVVEQSAETCQNSCFTESDVDCRRSTDISLNSPFIQEVPGVSRASPVVRDGVQQVLCSAKHAQAV